MRECRSMGEMWPREGGSNEARSFTVRTVLQYENVAMKNVCITAFFMHRPTAWYAENDTRMLFIAH